MKIVCRTIGAVLGLICGYISISILGWISLFSPQFSDDLLKKLQNWAKIDDD